MEIFGGLEHTVRETEPLAPHTWLMLGGPARFYAEPTCRDDLAEVVRRARENDVPTRLLGGGSNVLVRDHGYDGVVINLSAPAFSEIRVDGNELYAGAGAKLSHVVATSVREGLAGLEHLVGIPGSVGGALHLNSGSLSTDIGQWTRGATVLTRDGELITRQSNELVFSYRQSSLDELAILDAKFLLEEEDPAELTRRLQKLWIVRRANQPSGERGTCCMFRDPQGVSATELIEQVNLKGTSVGRVTLYDRDPNFLLADPGASSDDVLKLMDLVRERVATTFEIELDAELQIW